MKKILFIFLFSTRILFAQDYQPTLTEGAFWDVGFYSQDNTLGCLEDIRRYDLGELVEINGKEYFEVRIHRFSYEENYPCPSEYPGLLAFPSYTLADVYLREDIEEKKVFIWSDQITGTYQEYLLYDYSLEIGEQIINPYSLNETDLIITDKYLENGRLFFTTNLCDYMYIEGVGGLSGIISKIICPFEYFDDLFCHGDAETDTCAGYLSLTDLENSKVSIYPNPVKDKLSIETNSFINISFYSLLGDKLYSFDINKKTIINLSGLSKGIYLLKLTKSDKQNVIGKTYKIIKE